MQLFLKNIFKKFRKGVDFGFVWDYYESVVYETWEVIKWLM
jgi:hypothetical protein